MRVKLNRKMVKNALLEKIEELSGQDLKACYSCGKCAAGCPGVAEMDILPNQVVRLIQMGCEEEVKNSRTVWLCASCLMCTARCPRGVDLARVMEAVRQVVLRKNEDHVSPSKIDKKDLKELPQIALVGCFRKLTG